MKLLVDTNVLLDGYLKRQPFYEEWQEIRILQLLGGAELWASAKSFTDVFYLGRKAIGNQAIQRIMLESLDELRVCSIDGDDVRNAATAEWNDFEDCIIYQAALKTKADYIVTRNKRDFARSRIPVVTPNELLEKVHKTMEFRDESDDA